MCFINKSNPWGSGDVWQWGQIPPWHSNFQVTRTNQTLLALTNVVIIAGNTMKIQKSPE